MRRGDNEAQVKTMGNQTRSQDTRNKTQTGREGNTYTSQQTGSHKPEQNHCIGPDSRRCRKSANHFVKEAPKMMHYQNVTVCSATVENSTPPLHTPHQPLSFPPAAPSCGSSLSILATSVLPLLARLFFALVLLCYWFAYGCLPFTAAILSDPV